PVQHPHPLAILEPRGLSAPGAASRRADDARDIGAIRCGETPKTRMPRGEVPIKHGSAKAREIGCWGRSARAGLVGAARVTYIDHSNDGWIEKLGEDERRLNVLMPFMLKNISYEHEKEVRALVIAAMEKIGSDGLDLQVSLNDFIDEIVDNPFCQTWFTEAVAGVADRYGLESKRRRSSLSPDVFYMDRKQGREQLGAPL